MCSVQIRNDDWKWKENENRTKWNIKYFSVWVRQRESVRERGEVEDRSLRGEINMLKGENRGIKKGS